MPKHVGLGLAMKSMGQRKEIITMLNHNGQCINYWECEQSDTKWTEISLNQFEEEYGNYQATLPSNIASGVHLCKVLQTMQTTCRIALNQSVHVMSMAVYQGEFELDPKNLGFPAQNVRKVRRRVFSLLSTVCI